MASTLPDGGKSGEGHSKVAKVQARLSGAVLLILSVREVRAR